MGIKKVSESSSSPEMFKTVKTSQGSSSSGSPTPSPTPGTSSAPMQISPIHSESEKPDKSHKSRKEKHTSKKQKISEDAIKTEIKEEKPDVSRYDVSKARNTSYSEDDLSSDQGMSSTERFCQQHHMPHPTIEELRDKRYFARLQAI